MGITMIFFLGIIGAGLLLFFKKPIISIIDEDHKIIKKLKRSNWFQNPWLSGFFLFIMNAVLFISTLFVLYILVFFTIPYAHLLIMLLAVIVSMNFWKVLSRAWQGTKIKRLKMSMIGSSFYLGLSIIFCYMLITLKPYYQGEDTFMREIGLMFAIIVTAVAFFTSFVITGFSKEKIVK